MNFYQNSNQNRSYFSQAALNSINQSSFSYQQQNQINPQVMLQQPQNFLGFNQSSKMNISHTFLGDRQKITNAQVPQFPSLMPGQQYGQPMNLMNIMNQGQYSQPIYVKGPIVRHSPAQMFLSNFSQEQPSRQRPANLSYQQYPQEDITKEDYRQYPKETLNKDELLKTRDQLINEWQGKKRIPQPVKKITEDQSDYESSDVQSSDDELIPKQKFTKQDRVPQNVPSLKAQVPVIHPEPKIQLVVPTAPKVNQSISKISIPQPKPQNIEPQPKEIPLQKQNFEPQVKEIPIQNQIQTQRRDITPQSQNLQPQPKLNQTQNISQPKQQIVQDIPKEFIQKPLQIQKESPVIPQQKNIPQDSKQQELFPVKRQRQVEPKVEPIKNYVSNNNKKIPRVQKNLRLFYIRFLFINLYFRGLKKLILAKKQRFQLITQESLAKAIQLGTEWAMTFLEDHLMPFWRSKDKFDWLADDDLTKVEQSGRIRRSKMFIDATIDTLFEYMKESNFDKSLLKFLAEISQNYEFAPQNFFFAFEIKRFKFTTFGALKGMTSDHQKMVVALFLIIRIVLFTILYAPWQLGLDLIKETETLRENSLIVTSIIHELVVQEFRDLIIIKNNQDHIPQEHKVNPRLGPLKYEPDSKDPEERQYVRNLVEPLIFPLYDADEMNLIFEKEQDWVNAMRGKLDDLYDRMLKIVKEVYQNERKKQTRVKIVDKIKLLKQL